MKDFLKMLGHAALGGALAGVAPLLDTTVNPLIAAAVGSAISSVLTHLLTKDQK